MSGGSMDYFFSRLARGDVSFAETCLRIDESREVLEKAGADIEAYALEDAKKRLQNLLTYLQGYEKVFHAVEWNLSCDWELDAVKDAIRERRKALGG